MKRWVFVFLFLLILFPIVSSIEFTMKDEFRQGETLMAKVSGNFLEPPLAKNILFYRGHVRISITPYVGKINEEYYIYALLPETANNYSIVLGGMQYMDGSLISEENITKNFTITNSTADFSVSPAFVISDRTFSLDVQNLQNSPILIQISSATQSGDEEDFSYNDSISLKSGEAKKIKFEIGEIIEPTFKMIILTSGSSDSSGFWGSSEPVSGMSYEIPVDIFGINQEAKAEEKKEESSINLDEVEITENETEEYVPTTTATCAVLNGTICSATQTCDGKTENARDAPCCLGKCSEKTETSTLKIIGWLIVIAVIIFLAWFFKFKYRGAKTEINLLNIGLGKKKTE